MKKLIAFVLCFAMAFSMVACSSSLSTDKTEETATKTEETVIKTQETEDADLGPITLPQGFSVGWARADVTPANGTALAGYGAASNTKRLSAVVLDPLLLTCTAISDGENVVLLFTTDNLYVGQTILEQAAKLVGKIYEIPKSNIIMNATHTHSAAPLHYNGYAGEGAYLKKYYAAIKETAEGALRDLEGAEIYIGSAHTENLNYVRRYVNLADGSFAGKNLSGADPSKIGHETEADTQMQVLKFDRATKKDVVLVNWQCHPTGPGSEEGSEVSADWVGAFRKYMEEEGVLFSYHQGAAGNLAASSGIKGEPSNKDWNEHGKKLAAVAKTAMANMKKVNSGRVQAIMQTHTATYNTDYKPEGGTFDFLISGISIGDVAFVAAPYEMHDTNGMEIRAASPFEMTFVCAYSNGAWGYMASSAAFENGGYEVDSTRFVKGTGENVVSDLVGILKTLYQTK